MSAELSRWGMTIHYPDARLINILKAGRVGWLRTEVYFDQKPGPDQLPAAWNDVRAKVAAAYAPPVQQVYFGIIPGYPKWIADGRFADPSSPAGRYWERRFDYWHQFVTTVVDTFAPMGVRHFNVGNEANDPKFFPFGREEYLNLLLTAAPIIRKRGKLCGPDIATAEEHHPWSFLRSCFQWLQSANQCFDVVTVHGYCSRDGGVRDLILQLYPVMKAMRESGVNAPVWLTETGLSRFHFPTQPERDVARLKELCQWIGDGPAPSVSGSMPQIVVGQKFLKKIFFFVWSEHLEEGGKYAWLRSAPGGLLEPVPHLWDAYQSVTVVP